MCAVLGILDLAHVWDRTTKRAHMHTRRLSLHTRPVPNTPRPTRSFCHPLTTSPLRPPPQHRWRVAALPHVAPPPVVPYEQLYLYLYLYL